MFMLILILLSLLLLTLLSMLILLLSIDINNFIDIDIVVNIDNQGRRGGERAGRDGAHAHEDPPPAESRALRFAL